MTSSPSPYSAILHTNTVPSEQECAAIRAFLAQPREDLVVLEAEVERLEALLVDARTKRDQLRESISAHEALISPMRRIPEDILRAIFVATLPTNRNTALVATEGPSLIVQVCRYWREIALTTPRLWASMHIVIPHDTVKLEALKDTMGSWLEKSGAVPVDISLQHQHTAPQLYDPWPSAATLEGDDLETAAPPAELRGLVSDLLRMLLSVARRWRSIRVPLVTAENRLLLARLTAADAPLLKHIEIVHDSLMPPMVSDLNSSATSEPLSDFEVLSSDSLRSFSFHGPYNAMPQIVSWRNLRHLKLVASNFDYAADISFSLAILAECPHLLALNISLSGYNVTFGADLPIQLAELTDCSLDIINSRIMLLADTTNPEPQLFDIMQTPALQTLHLRVSATSGVLSGVLLPIGGHLKSLTLALDHIFAAEFAPALAVLPLVEELFLSGEPYTPVEMPQDIDPPHHGPVFTEANSFKALIASHDGATTYCPSLMRLELIRVFATQDSTLLALLQSRIGDAAHRHGVTPLKWFKCQVSRPRQLELELANSEGVREAVETGELVLDATFLSAPPQDLLKYSPLEGTEFEPNRAPVFGMGLGDF